MRQERRGLLAGISLLVVGSIAAPISDPLDVVLQPAPVVPKVDSHPLVDELNSRYSKGQPSNSLREAGVVVHQFDDAGFNTTTRHVKAGGVARWDPWTPCPAGQWCHKFSDRMSTSVLNAAAPYMFSAHNGGFVIDASTADQSTLCSWASDARGMRAARSCIPKKQGRFVWSAGWQTYEARPGCVPGCVNDVKDQREDVDTKMAGMKSPTWCEEGAGDTWCPWKGHQLQRMLEQQQRLEETNDCAQGNGCRYNELVLNSSVWVERLPSTIQAVFALKSGRTVPGFHEVADESGVAGAIARRAHRNFLQGFGLTDATVPLLELDLENHAAPFRELANPLLTGTKHSKHFLAAAELNKTAEQEFEDVLNVASSSDPEAKTSEQEYEDVLKVAKVLKDVLKVASSSDALAATDTDELAH